MIIDFDVTFISNGDIKKILDIATEKSSLEVAINAAAQAKALAPVDSGRLRNAIMYKTTKKKGGFNNVSGESAPFEVTTRPREDKEAIVGFNLLYGVYQEFGTRRMKPQPFLRPSMALVKGANGADIIKKIQEEELRGKLKPGQKRESFI